MSTSSLSHPHVSASPSSFGKAFDTVAMGVFPLIARLFGYRFRVGTSPDLERDGKAVLDAVWSAKGLLSPPDAAHFGERYDRGTTWIVCYRGTQPVGVMGLLDMRIASIALDAHGCLPPPHLDLNTTREICRLAILPEFRGGAQVIMIGLLREMLSWSRAHGIVRLFTGSTQKLYRIYQRYNPTARLVTAAPAPSEDPLQTRYYESLRQSYIAGSGVNYTFDVAGASPWDVFSRFLTGRLRRPASGEGGKA